MAYKARNREDLLAGVDEFLDKVTVLPPGEWDPNIRLEPPPEVGWLKHCDSFSVTKVVIVLAQLHAAPVVWYMYIPQSTLLCPGSIPG